MVRLAVGAASGHRARHSARHSGRHQPAGAPRLWPLLLFFQAIGDIAWLPILVIWFGYGLTTMTFVIVYTVIFPVVLNTVLGVRSVRIDLASRRAAVSAPRARACFGKWCCRARCPTSSPACATGSATAGAR